MSLDHNDPNDCPNCTYGPEYIDDGVPTRPVVKSCPECAELGKRALDFLVSAKLLRQKPEGTA